MGIRRKAREAALQLLYQMEWSDGRRECTDELFASFCHHFELNRKAISYSRELVAGICGQWEEIDGMIRAYAANWRVERMSLIDRNILRIAIFELCFREDVPARVAINEAIEVAKRFGSEESGPFINGILDAIQKSTDTEDRAGQSGQGTME